MGCTDAAANIILYREKYKTEICECGGFVLRKYHALQATEKDISFTRPMYGFPMGNGDLREVFDFIAKDAASSNEPIAFPLLSSEEKLFLEKKFPNKFTYIERRDDSDYLYLTKNLADLPGRKFHKKKNHISQFMRKYPDAELKAIDETNKADALFVENEWYIANGGGANADTAYERAIINEALNNFEELHLMGGILYVAQKPVAMTIGCAVSENVGDVQFEKVIPEFDRDGGYAVINNKFAKTMTQFEYLNREEDLGIEGLRKAKLSYYPDILLSKWSAT